eukprot:TRINITY_DN14786_c0_g1_i1.p2 TRINITY_DN14786_c0_g1~~TRINITY_DN14786_c0_g1_i1.p2  ORF type:complete len:300 (-),score=40.74 TRINITY_DN14786_c0_g1_i1:1533-2432(-)
MMSAPDGFVLKKQALNSDQQQDLLSSLFEERLCDPRYRVCASGRPRRGGSQDCPHHERQEHHPQRHDREGREDGDEGDMCLWSLPSPKSGDMPNQAMRFGVIPAPVEALLLPVAIALLPAPLQTRRPYFDQLIVNLYRAGQGIKAHVDLDKFEDGIVGFSFCSSAVMIFERLDKSASFQVLLEPGDVYCMSGSARYDWTHEIECRGLDVVEGVSYVRTTRISVTLRKMRLGSGGVIALGDGGGGDDGGVDGSSSGAHVDGAGCGCDDGHIGLSRDEEEELFGLLSDDSDNDDYIGGDEL